MISEPLVWKTHKRREDFNECPHCGATLRWVYDGYVWYPCDKEPVLFILHPQGNKSVVYKKQLYDNCVLYKTGDRRFEGMTPLQGNMQHWFTCPVLRESRKEYIRNLMSNRRTNG